MKPLYEIEDDYFENKLPTIEDDEISSSFGSEFTIYFNNGIEEDYVKIEGYVYFDIEEENADFDHDFGTESRTEYNIERIKFSHLKVWLDDKLVMLNEEELMEFLHDIENLIEKKFYI